MYAALSWVPRGVAQVKLPPPADDDAAPPAAAAAPAGSDSDDASVDIGDVLAADLDGLAVFRSNRDDPYLAADDEACAAFDEEELDDLRVRATDVLLVAAKGGDDASILEFHLLEDSPEESDDEGGYKPHVYVHHDVVLPTLPLCTAVTSLRRGEEQLNLVAVGCFTPGIDVWDVDLVNVLEPAAVLGGYESEEEEEGTGGTAGRGGKQKKAKSKTKKKRPKLRLKDGSHTDAVMALCWNPLQREYLASGSADTTVKIWDIESAHCARTFAHHSGKVQSVAWHHAEESALLTGSFDRTVQVLDVRLPEAPAHTAFGVGADVESVLWGIGPLEGRVLAATEDGQVSIFDRRVAGAPLSTFQAHGAAVSAICLSADVPGLLVTGSVDKTLKVWDTRPCAAGKAAVPELVYERISKAGAIFGSALCPVHGGHPSASPFFLAYAGAKGVLVVADLAVESEMVRTRFSGAASTEAAAVIGKRAARVVSAAKNRDFNAARRQARSAKMKDESGSDDSDASGSNSSSSDWETDSGKEDGDTL